jgi:hypothetical protein
MNVPPHWDRTDVKALKDVVPVIGGVELAGTVAPYGLRSWNFVPVPQ